MATLEDDGATAARIPDPPHVRAAAAAVGVPTLAVLGTMSDAGKSTITAGLCRVLRNGGIRPAPFKAQNMSNNAYPALIPLSSSSSGENWKDEMKTGRRSSYGEIGVAQAVQARACRLPPTVHMNPVLLKSGGTRRRPRPIRRRSASGGNKDNEDSSSSSADADEHDVEYLCTVVVLGRTLAVETFGELGQRRDTLLELVLRAHDDLIRHASADVVVMEGAGSCTELNLMSRDIVNLPLVRALQNRGGGGRCCKWLLVANIDCGGVFAQIVGTKACLPAEDWDHCVGIVINKLRGESKYFEPGPKMIEDMVGKPVFVIPFLRGLNLPEEDGLGIERRLANESQLDDEVVQEDDAHKRSVVIVIAYPYMSMADDVLALENDDRFVVQWRRQHIPTWYPDAIVLPGSRIVCSDLRWLHETGWADYVRRHAFRGGRALGLCGGYQMLGMVVQDPLHVEGDVESQCGLSLLPVETTLATADAKTVAPRTGQLLLSPNPIGVQGFELHCGRTSPVPPVGTTFSPEQSYTPLLEMDHDESFEGLTNGHVAGTYLHGILQSADARAELLMSDNRKAALAQAGGHSEGGDTHDPLDRLADHLASHGLTFDTIMRMLAD